MFTYHHSRAEGWRCVLEALVKAGFGIVATHPIKAEMSAAAPKRQAREPIDLDSILVCRKRQAISSKALASALLIDDTAQEAAAQMTRLNNSGRSLSRNDVRVIFMAQIIKRLSWKLSLDESLHYLDTDQTGIESAIDHLYRYQQVSEPAFATHETQLPLW